MRSACLLRALLVGLAFAWSRGASVSAAADLPPLRSERPPLFSADVAVSLDAEGRPGLSVAISVAYAEFQWIKTPRGYGAAVEFTVVFEPRTGRSYGNSWERRMLVSDFVATRSNAATVVERAAFQVPPGRYEVRVTVRDLSADEGATVRDRVEVPDYSKIPVGFADLELGVMERGAFEPLPSRRYGRNVGRIAARAILFDRRPGDWPRRYPFRFRILDEAGNEVRTGTRDVEVGRSADPVIVRPDSSDLFLGHYVFEVELVEGRSRWRVDRSFDVDESGPPRGKDFERMLEPLSYIAEESEIDSLEALPPERQERGWEAFWRRRDPTPDTPLNEALIEFFRRVRHAERHFQNFGPGWRSDMGRIYIKFGPPDQVESRPATPYSPPLEIWYYNRPYRRFVFMDREGFGRYVLAGPTAE